MCCKVIEENLVFGKYRVLKLNRDVPGVRGSCSIRGKRYEPEYLRMRPAAGPAPRNWIAIRTTESFLGARVTFR